MPSLKAWGQGSGAPAHLQLVQRPALHRLGEICRRLVVVEKELLEGSKALRPASPICCSKCSGQRMPKSQGMGTRQWGASSPVAPPCCEQT